MKLAIACDHGGLELKKKLIEFLKKNGHEVNDYGTYTKESCDYPVFAGLAARAVQSGECERGIVICTTGVGISIAANRYRGIRCALCGDLVSARLTRLHNDANMLALGAGIIGEKLAYEIVSVFLETPFSGEERHARRIGLIEECPKDGKN